MKKLTFRALALGQSDWRGAKSFFALYGGQFTFSTQLSILNYLLINGFFGVAFVFCSRLMRSIRSSDEAVWCISKLEAKILKYLVTRNSQNIPRVSTVGPAVVSISNTAINNSKLSKLPRATKRWVVFWTILKYYEPDCFKIPHIGHATICL